MSCLQIKCLSCMNFIHFCCIRTGYGYDEENFVCMFCVEAGNSSVCSCHGPDLASDVSPLTSGTSLSNNRVNISPLAPANTLTHIDDIKTCDWLSSSPTWCRNPEWRGTAVWGSLWWDRCNKFDDHLFIQMTGAVLCHDIIILYLHEDSTQNKIYVREEQDWRWQSNLCSLFWRQQVFSRALPSCQASRQWTCCQGSTRSVQENWSRHCTRTGPTRSKYTSRILQSETFKVSDWHLRLLLPVSYCIGSNYFTTVDFNLILFSLNIFLFFRPIG